MLNTASVDAAPISRAKNGLLKDDAYTPRPNNPPPILITPLAFIGSSPESVGKKGR
jgi:hypothetical protein